MPDGDHNYGLKIIADTGDFQWSDQFGISNSISNSSSTPANAPTPSKNAVKESAEAVKESTKAVSQASDGQIQEPTGTVDTKTMSNTVKVYATGESKTLSKDHTHSTYTQSKDHVPKPSASGKHLSANLGHYEGANATHIPNHQKSHILPPVITTPATESVTPTVTPSVPTTLPQTTGTSPNTVTPPTSLKTTFSAGVAAKAAVTGVPLVLGAMAALIL